MDIAKKQQRRTKAQDFIKSGSKIPEPKKTHPAEVSPREEKQKGKKHVAYYLDKDLIQQIQIQAAKNGEKPCHLIERAVKRELS
ncbi:hypothetical protein KKI24_24360 [bacterium]|nr:hypothetical protein [bacterium]